MAPLRPLSVLTLLVCLVGCTEGPSAPSSASVDEFQAEPSPAAENQSAGDRDVAAVTTREPAAIAAPADATELLTSPPASLRTWALREELPSEQRVAAARQLAHGDSEAGFELALELSRSDDALVCANAVGILARSEDPRAAQRLAELDPKYQRLARTLRERKER